MPSAKAEEASHPALPTQPAEGLAPEMLHLARRCLLQPCEHTWAAAGSSQPCLLVLYRALMLSCQLSCCWRGLADRSVSRWAPGDPGMLLSCLSSLLSVHQRRHWSTVHLSSPDPASPAAAEQAPPSDLHTLHVQPSMGQMRSPFCSNLKSVRPVRPDQRPSMSVGQSARLDADTAIGDDHCWLLCP